ncbi:MAG: polyphosphate kinase 1 [SAR324 cluster bacterium]|nr:polyphosphate kinase 1 [SAR324 cluster bacterium]
MTPKKAIVPKKEKDAAYKGLTIKKRKKAEPKKEKSPNKKKEILKRKSKDLIKKIRLNLTNQPPEISFPTDWSHCDPENLDHPSLYINRELSWCQFNMRVLEESLNPNHPLLERVKFLAIVGSNLDEFFMVRVATHLKIIRAGIENVTPDGLNTTEAFWAIQAMVTKMVNRQRECWNTVLRPLLAEESIKFLELPEYTTKIKKYLAGYFKKEIFPVLTPLAFDPVHPFPHISNLSLNFAVVVQHSKQVKFARVKIPANLPRFVRLPENLSANSEYLFVFLEDVIKANMHELFPNTVIEEIYLFRVIRDTDIEIREDEASDLLEVISHSLKQMRYGEIAHLELEEEMPDRVLEILIENFDVSENVIGRTRDRMGFSDWMSLMSINKPQLKDPLLKPFNLFNSNGTPESIFDRIKYQDQIVHHPYDSFSAVEAFLKAAVDDPQVIAIKMTLYRVDSNSPVVKLLMQAREIGKQVAVLVELKARFDEESNILWAQRMEEVGVHMVYGVVHLKTHCKLCLVVRKEADGIRCYSHIGTGNYNRVTSRIYTDLGIFTAYPEIVEDVSEVFNFLTGYSNQEIYSNLLVAPVNLRSGLVALIENEAELAKAGKAARLIFKVNHVADQDMIQTLYRASQAGVKIDLLVRGVCCLRPGIPGISDNIRVNSVIGRFLEHSRIYYFHNEGKAKIYIGSADLMERNLKRRVEVLTPVRSEKIRNYLKTHVLELMLNDNQQASKLQTNGDYIPITQAKKKPVNTHRYLIEFSENKKPTF